MNHYLSLSLFILTFTLFQPWTVGISLKWLLCPGDDSQHCLNNLMLLVKDTPGSSCTFPAQAMELRISPRVPNYILWKLQFYIQYWTVYILIISHLFSLDRVWQVYLCRCLLVCVWEHSPFITLALTSQNAVWSPKHEKAFLNTFRLWHSLQASL